MVNIVVDRIPEIIVHYGLNARDYAIAPVGSGYIHYTFKLSGHKNYILQRVNKNVFKKPEIIAANLRVASDYLKKSFPDFLFLSAIPTSDDREMVYDEEGFPWRLYPYFENTFTIDKVSTDAEAYSAAAEFARLTKYLDKADSGKFKATIDRFHDLSWRYEQFETSLAKADTDRLTLASEEITKCKSFSWLAEQYRSLVRSGSLRLRVTHNDTKINNILFDASTQQAICAIDLDTLMPGYFIYDLGDMIRTFVSPVDEEEKDLSQVFVRKNIYDALIKGYLSQMTDHLSEAEKSAIPFSGMMMTYIMALRMLTDFLNGDVYYQIRYEGQNLVRARNQLKLLQELEKLQ
jgi:thiamine kinase-like enzyme